MVHDTGNAHSQRTREVALVVPRAVSRAWRERSAACVLRAAMVVRESLCVARAGKRDAGLQRVRVFLFALLPERA